MKGIFVFLLTLLTVIVSYSQTSPCLDQWDRFKKVTDNEGLLEAMDKDPELLDAWEKLDNAGVYDMQAGYSKAAKSNIEKQWIEDLKNNVYKSGNKVSYLNKEGRLMTWSEQYQGSMTQTIESAINNTKDAGKPIEGKVAKYIRDQGKPIEAFGMEVYCETIKNVAGDIDILTKNELIEVKKSFSAWSSKKEQVNKFATITDPLYINPQNRNVILYIDELLTEAQRTSILSTIPGNVTLVNSLDELLKILR